MIKMGQVRWSGFKVHSRSGDPAMDFFAGSGTLGETAAKLGRDYVPVHDNPEAVELIAKRLAPAYPD